MANAKTDWKDGDKITKESMNDIGNDIKTNREKNTEQDQKIQQGETKDTEQDGKITALEGKTGDAGTAKKGIVKMATKVDAVSAENAGTIGGAFAQAEVQKIATLADANKTAINAILTALKNAGIMSSQ